MAITHHQSPSSRQILLEDGVYDANSAQSTVDDSISWYDIDGAGERHIHTQIYIYIYYLYVYIYIYVYKLDMMEPAPSALTVSLLWISLAPHTFSRDLC